MRPQNGSRKSWTQARHELEQIAQRDGDLAKAGELAYGAFPELEKKLAEAKRNAEPGKGAMVDGEAVTDDHIAQVVSRWTGIPVDKMLEGERDKLLRMEDALPSASSARREAVAGRLDGGSPGTRRSAGSQPSRSARSCSLDRPASARRS